MSGVNYTYRAKLDRVIDGDTVVLTVDNGFYNREHHSFRLKDVNTPEIFTKDAAEKANGYMARDRLQEWFDLTHECVKDTDSEYWPLVIVTDKDRQTFNRYIADIECAECGDWLNGMMRNLGYV